MAFEVFPQGKGYSFRVTMPEPGCEGGVGYVAGIEVDKLNPAQVRINDA